MSQTISEMVLRDAVDDVEDGVDDMTRNRTEDRNVNDNHTIDGQE